MCESATERGDRIEREAVAVARPILREQFKLALGLAGRLSRDRAAGVRAQVACREAVEAGLDQRIADAVRDGLNA